MRGAQGKPRLSSTVLQTAILQVFTEKKLFPAGVYAEIPSVQEWALRHGKALKKLASGLAFNLGSKSTPRDALYMYTPCCPNKRSEPHSPSPAQASRLKRLVRRSKNAKLKSMNEVKALCRDCGWLFKPSKPKPKSKKSKETVEKAAENEDQDENESETWQFAQTFSVHRSYNSISLG